MLPFFSWLFNYYLYAPAHDIYFFCKVYLTSGLLKGTGEGVDRIIIIHLS